MEEQRARAREAEAQRNAAGGEDRVGAHSPLLMNEQPRRSKEMEMSARPPQASTQE